jgi:hypothetical protein
MPVFFAGRRGGSLNSPSIQKRIKHDYAVSRRTTPSAAKGSRCHPSFVRRGAYATHPNNITFPADRCYNHKNIRPLFSNHF